MVSAFGELTGKRAIKNMHRMMQNDPEGAQILRDKPIVTSQILDIDNLSRLPDNTFGKEFVQYLDRNNITVDSRKPVLFVDDPELAYVICRYRQIHDFTHCLLNMKTNMLGEVTVKIFEAIQLGLPMCWLAGYFGVLRLGPKHTEAYLNKNLPWIIDNALKSKPLINCYFEKHLEKPIDQLRSELNISPL